MDLGFGPSTPTTTTTRRSTRAPATSTRSSSERGVQVVQQGTHAAAARGRQDLPLHPEPHLRPDHRARLPRPRMFRGQIPEGVDPRSLIAGRAARARVPDRDARLAVMDEQGLDAVLHVPDARLWRRAGAARRHPGDDGHARTRSTAGSTRTGASRTRTASSPRRCSRSPIPTPRSPSSTRSLERGARIVHVRPAPVPDRRRRRPLARRSRSTTRCGRGLAEATIPVAFHLGDSGYDGMFAAAWGGADDFEPFRGPSTCSSKLVVVATGRSTTPSAA